jgi:transporter family protein
MVAVNFLVSLPIYIVFLIATLVIVDGDTLEPEYLFYALIGASTARGGYYLYLEALEKGSVTMVGSISAAYPAITAILAVTVLGEDVSAINGIGIVIIIASMIGLSYMHGRASGEQGFSRSALFLSMVVLLVWGFGGIFIKLSLSGIPLIAYLGVYPFILPPIAFAYLRHKRATREMMFPKWSVPVMAAAAVALLWQLGYFAETGAISAGEAAIVFPLVSAYPIVTILGARLFLNERLSKVDWALLALVVIGIVLTSVV